LEADTVNNSPDPTPVGKDVWDKVQSLATIVSLLLVPVVLAVLGNMFVASNAAKASRVQMVGLAVGVLSTKPSNDEDLREWAVKVIDKYSEIPLSAKAAEQLAYKVVLDWSAVQVIGYIDPDTGSLVAPDSTITLPEIIER
jgi:hypothetical protein